MSRMSSVSLNVLHVLLSGFLYYRGGLTFCLSGRCLAVRAAFGRRSALRPGLGAILSA